MGWRGVPWFASSRELVLAGHRTGGVGVRTSYEFEKIRLWAGNREGPAKLRPPGRAEAVPPRLQGDLPGRRAAELHAGRLRDAGPGEPEAVGRRAVRDGHLGGAGSKPGRAAERERRGAGADRPCELRRRRRLEIGRAHV